ncbi:hypothetical protein D0860_00546 [Hortaea werneckii]|uniref:Histone H1 n=1 Tax=Hortaea werneckii TaxID=91943 RepID=A0A3M7I8Z4_HORWE|nr:hypothetical protein D0860_00546 [Hortaea werneckii]RMZ22077.1 hypothetical protein D0859_13905 [Hortaea werneckii]
MPPKKATTTTKKAAAPAHASYQAPENLTDVYLYIQLKERNGSSRQAIKKYVHANNKLDGISDKAFTTQLNRAIASGSEKGVFSRPKGPSGPVKLAQPSSKTAAPAAKTTTTKSTTAKAPAKAKSTTTKKAPAAKSTTKKTTTTTKKAAPAKKATATKATTTKSTANTSKVRKTPAAAPAVETKKAEALGKTKSGRVVKSSASQPEKKTAGAKKATTKKAAAKKS